MTTISENPTNQMAIALAIKDSIMKQGAGGMTSSGRDFVSNVSAVVSVMVNKRGELIAHGGTYGLTDAGRAAWNAIKSTTAYQNRPANLFSTVQ